MSDNVHRLVIPRRSNEALDEPLDSREERAMIAGAAKKIEELLDILRIDHRNDHNTRDTPMRVARMYVQELLQGRFALPPRITEFDNVEGFDQLIVTGPIEVRSLCAHHLLPIYGHAMIGILPAPDGKIIGLSKYDRIVQHFAARFQIQEELIKQIASSLADMTSARGLAVRISAVHMCKTHRGVRASHASRMVNTVFLGELLHDDALKREFLQECRAREQAA
jgi:GTP cyclohydrolase I